jgi:hypothetical protein
MQIIPAGTVRANNVRLVAKLKRSGTRINEYRYMKFNEENIT